MIANPHCGPIGVIASAATQSLHNSSLRAQRSNPLIEIARSTMDCFVASLLAMTIR
jgi:hypothetical protein